MINPKTYINFVIFFFIFSSYSAKTQYYTYYADPHKDNIELYWKDDNGKILKTFENLNYWLGSKGKHLQFAMNGGMFMEDFIPLGLFIQNNKKITPLNTRLGTSNFYIQPNGVFYITKDNHAHISPTNRFVENNQIKFAIQSGVMLVINNKINDILYRYNSGGYIRNGVGVLPDGSIIFVLSKKEISIYEFAKYFEKLKCVSALYLDGAISAIYYPEKKITDSGGVFGVIIGITY